MDTRSLIEEKLRGGIADIVELDVIDQSAAHAGHAGARDGAGHFHVILVSASFDGQTPIQRQRTVYRVLADEMHSCIHALSMTCLSPAEYEAD
jgi:BolA protein